MNIFEMPVADLLARSMGGIMVIGYDESSKSASNEANRLSFCGDYESSWCSFFLEKSFNRTATYPARILISPKVVN
jgi:hypothetical protein